MRSACRARCSGLRSGWRTTASPRASFAGSSGDGYASSSIPSRQGDIASAQLQSRLCCAARAEGLEAASVARWIDLFTTHGVKRFFVWLSPGPDMDDGARLARSARALAPSAMSAIPRCCRDGDAPAPFKTDLEIREVTSDEIAAAREALGETMWPGYLRSAGRDGFFHYMAFDGTRPVATAALAVFEDMAYLLSAATGEADRKRGAQQALIAARLARAGQTRLRHPGLRNPQHPRALPAQSAARRLSRGLRERGLCLSA